MVMAPPCARSLCVAKENVVTDDVFFKETRSRSDIIILTSCTWPRNMARLVAPWLISSADVLIFRPVLLDAISPPVTSSPLANEILCGPPAGKVPPDVVHTMLNVRVTIAHDTFTSTDPEAESRVPRVPSRDGAPNSFLFGLK